MSAKRNKKKSNSALADKKFKAIFFQQSPSLQSDFQLVEITSIRELFVDKLKFIIDEVKEERRICDEECIYETFTLFNKVREYTLLVVEGIEKWQQGFTKVIHPPLLQCNYILERLVKHIAFVNSTNLRRVFNFQINRGNFLLLPLPNPRTIEPNRVSSKTAEQILLFANASEEKVAKCYQFLINTMEPKEFQKILPIEVWLMSKWIPRLQIVDRPRSAPRSRPQSANTSNKGHNNNNNNASNKKKEPSPQKQLDAKIKRVASLPQIASSSHKDHSSPDKNQNHKQKQKPSDTTSLPRLPDTATAGFSSPLLVSRGKSARQLVHSVSDGAAASVSTPAAAAAVTTGGAVDPPTVGILKSASSRLRLHSTETTSQSSPNAAMSRTKSVVLIDTATSDAPAAATVGSPTAAGLSRTASVARGMVSPPPLLASISKVKSTLSMNPSESAEEGGGQLDGNVPGTLARNRSVASLPINSPLAKNASSRKLQDDSSNIATTSGASVELLQSQPKQEGLSVESAQAPALAHQPSANTLIDLVNKRRALKNAEIPGSLDKAVAGEVENPFFIQRWGRPAEILFAGRRKVEEELTLEDKAAKMSIKTSQMRDWFVTVAAPDP